MVSRGLRKRGVGVMGVRAARSPITLAREMLLRGEDEDGGGAQGHSQLCGKICDDLAKRWGLELVRPSYFFTRLRWDQHRRGLGLSHTDEEYCAAKREADKHAGYKSSDRSCDTQSTQNLGETTSFLQHSQHWPNEYIPKGTVGCVVLDSTGTLCVATSTGGLTNKLPGRIGDTPSLGAGFWAEEWTDILGGPLIDDGADSSLVSLLSDCMLGDDELRSSQAATITSHLVRGAAMSGTGNGDSFLRVNAARTAAAIARFSRASNGTAQSLQHAVTAIAGPGGVLQRSAEDRWGSGEGEGGLIGIELSGGVGKVVFDYNCCGMFHAWIDDFGKERFAVFQDEK